MQQEQAHEKIAQAKAALAGAIGVSAQALDTVTIVTTEMEKPLNASLDMESLRKRALEQHPALKAAWLDYKAAHEALKLELAKQVPDIDLGPGYEWNSQGGGKFTLGLSIVLPIANNNEGPIAEAEAKRKLAASTLNALQATTISAIEQATASFMTAQNTVKTSEKLLNSEKTRFGQLKQQLGNRETGKLPLLYAQSNIRAICRGSRFRCPCPLCSGCSGVRRRIAHPTFLACLPEYFR
ncbi:MAG: TolC family protein [Rickettsiales bacterium]